VVVPTFQRPALLRDCIEALCHQTLAPDRYEILVIDDGRDAATRQLVDAAAVSRTTPAIHYLTSLARQSGPAAARNVGWKAARGEIIAFTDDDCRPHPRWLSAGLAVFEDPDIAGAWGRIVVPIPSDPTDYERNTANLERAPFATANCFYRRTALHAVRGFDERFTAAWREDSDMQFSLLERGFRLAQAPGAIVEHPVRQPRWGISVEQQRNNLFNALLFKKHPLLYRRLIQPSPPWDYYANVAALLGSVAGAAMGWTWLGGPSVVLWLVGVGGFCVHRLRHTSRHTSHVLEMLITSALIPPVAVYWRLRGAVKYRVAFL
jgi:glycosyltransferase involved in cell wall biosynthesis